MRRQRLLVIAINECLGRLTDKVQLQRIKQNSALDVSASERLRAYHTSAVSCNRR
jgi:hypothetical protein